MTNTVIDEIADGIYRLSTFVPDVGPTGFTFNQFLIDDDCCSTPGNGCCSTRSAKRSPPSSRSRHSDGSPSGTSKPTSAAR